jgi:ribonuclease R
VHVTALPADYYHFDPVHHRLSGERSGRSFRLGDSVEVTVMRVDLDERKIDFELSQAAAGKTPPGRARAGAAGGKAGARGKGDVVVPGKSMAGNTDVQKSREVKKALLAGSKGAAKPGSGRGAAKAAPGGSEKKSSASRGGAAKSGVAPAGSGKPRKRKAKS